MAFRKKRAIVLQIFFIVTAATLSFKNKNPGTGPGLGFIPVKAMMSNAAADAVGVNTHINYFGSVYEAHYGDIIRPRLVELGVKHIRDHFGNAKINSRYVDLAHNFGIRLLLINNDNGDDLEISKTEVKRLNAIDTGKPVVELIEPANERDGGWHADWKKLCGYMQDYKKAYKEDAATSSIPTLGPSFANTRNSATDFAKVCPDASACMDFGNLHAYSGLFPESPLAGGWGISFERAIESYRAVCAGKPVIETESGYKMSEGADGHPAVSERTAAKYSPRLVLERLRHGVGRLYFYQLINNAEDFGLLNADGSPRLQFTALSNFIHLMADTGGDFSTDELSYILKGDLTDIRQMLFQKRNGNFLLIVWQGINGSEGGTHNKDYKNIENPDRQLTLNLEKKAASIKLYRPSFDTLPDGKGMEPVAEVKNTSVLNLMVPDHIVVAEISLRR